VHSLRAQTAQAKATKATKGTQAQAQPATPPLPATVEVSRVPEAHSPTFLRFQLGARLRELRESAGLRAEQVGEHVDCSASTVSRIEGGKVGIRRGVLLQLLDLYGVTDEGHREDLLVLAKQGKQRGWWARYGELPAAYAQYVGFESAAAEIRNYEPLIVPGQLQTEDYLRALFRAAEPYQTEETVEKHVRVRLTRQDLLTKANPVRLLTVLDEGVLRRLIGGPDVMRGQLKRLSEAARMPNVTIQILPFSGGAYAGMAGSFAILDFPAADAPTIACAEGLTGALYAEGDDAQRYMLVFDSLRAAALSPLESARLIDSVRDELA
jgi:transcriptional regulator with XRE-family HTH domain